MSCKPAALFFDFDGTLLDSEPLHYQAWADTMKELGESPLCISFTNYVGISDQAIALSLQKERNLPMPWEELFGRKQRHYHRLSEEGSSEESSLIQQCMSRWASDFLLAIVTSSPADIVLTELKKMGIDRLFSFIIDCDAVSKHKPHPEPYIEALKRSGLSAAACIAIEDSPAGIQSATTANLGVVWLNRYGIDQPEGNILKACANWHELKTTSWRQFLV